MKRAAVIYFPGRVDLEALKIQVQDITEKAGWEPTLYLPTDGENHGRQQALAALAQKSSHILVAGGDGTIREVAVAIAEQKSNATLGLIPSGTGNVLARNLNLDLNNLKACVKQALQGNRHPIDLVLARIIHANGERSEHGFVVMAGLGLDAQIMQATDSKRKRQLGWVAYIEGGFKSLPLRYERLAVTIDSAEPRNLRVLTLLVGNAGWLPGRIGLMPDASLDDGELDLAAIGPRRFWQWVDFWSRVTLGNRALRPTRIGRKLLDATANIKTLENMSGRKVRVTPTHPVHLQLDGDGFGEVLEVEFEVMPRAMSVRV
ncbi:MAG: hypothetical protein KGL41_04455 [Actinomycetales bacterium]|nr:hypothetical protein [Actinomycetales bacterium]